MARRRSRGSKVSRKRSRRGRKTMKRSKVSRKRSRVSRKRSRVSRNNRTGRQHGGSDFTPGEILVKKGTGPWGPGMWQLLSTDDASAIEHHPIEVVFQGYTGGAKSHFRGYTYGGSGMIGTLKKEDLISEEWRSHKPTTKKVAGWDAFSWAKAPASNPPFSCQGGYLAKNQITKCEGSGT